jgi:hypothetical protein
MTHGLLVVTVLLGALALASPSPAAPPCREYEIGLPIAATRTLGPDAPPAEVIAAAGSTIRDKLDLPLSAAYKAYVCFGEAAFAEGLLRHLGVRAVGSDWRSVPAAAGVATRVGVFLRGDYLVRAPLERRVTVVAHELAHLWQQDAAKHREDRLPVWMLEGHADWVAFQVLELLGIRSYDASRTLVVRSVGGSVTPVEHFPDLDALADHASWSRSVRSLPATYGQAFLAVEYLIERSSRAALVRFMSAAAKDGDPRDGWAEAFSMPYREFVDDFRGHLKSLGRRGTGATVDPKSVP